MEMTQAGFRAKTLRKRSLSAAKGFILLGKNPGLFVLGEPTHDREDFHRLGHLQKPQDLDEKHRKLPDPKRTKAKFHETAHGCSFRVNKRHILSRPAWA